MCHYYAVLCCKWHSLYTELFNICTTFNDVTKVTKLWTSMLEAYTQTLNFTAKFVRATFGEASSFCGNDRGGGLSSSSSSSHADCSPSPPYSTLNKLNTHTLTSRKQRCQTLIRQFQYRDLRMYQQLERWVHLNTTYTTDIECMVHLNIPYTTHIQPI